MPTEVEKGNLGEVSTAPPKKVFLDYMNYFRGVAIIFIVAGHTLVWGHSTMKDFNSLLFASGTYFFVFIAGFLFQYLSPKFEIKNFYKKKLINVICPYFVTFLPFALMYSIQNVDDWAFTHVSFFKRLFAVTIGPYIFNGPLWFIGMISIMFLFSPLFLYIQKKTKFRIALFLSTFILCLIVHRISSVNMFIGFNQITGTYWDIFLMNIKWYFRAFVHFSFIYILGMEVCFFINKYKDWVQNNLLSVFQISTFLYVFHFIVQLFIIKDSTNLHLISKVIEIFVLLSGLMLIQDKIKDVKFLDWFLNVCAKYSFGIFFIHGFIINMFYWHSPLRYLDGSKVTFRIISQNNIHCFLTSLEIFFISFFASLLILWIIKTILNKLGIKNTRMFIGV